MYASVAPPLTVRGPYPCAPEVDTVSVPAFTTVPPECFFWRFCMIISPTPSFTSLPALGEVKESKVTVWFPVSTVKVCELKFSPQSSSFGAPLSVRAGS